MEPINCFLCKHGKNGNCTLSIAVNTFDGKCDDFVEKKVPNKWKDRLEKIHKWIEFSKQYDEDKHCFHEFGGFEFGYDKERKWCIEKLRSEGYEVTEFEQLIWPYNDFIRVSWKYMKEGETY